MDKRWKITITNNVNSLKHLETKLKDAFKKIIRFRTIFRSTNVASLSWRLGSEFSNAALEGSGNSVKNWSASIASAKRTRATSKDFSPPFCPSTESVTNWKQTTTGTTTRSKKLRKRAPKEISISRIEFVRRLRIKTSIKVWQWKMSTTSTTTSVKNFRFRRSVTTGADRQLLEARLPDCHLTCQNQV